MSTGITEIECEKLLALSQIPLGDVVVNPYRGCVFGCAYCYVRLNKQARKRDAAWGTYVDVKVNALAILERELTGELPGRVLLGSTTEVYQPVEERYQLTRQILERLNRETIAVTIMTRSLLIERDIDLLKENRDAIVYFTLSPFSNAVQHVLEPGAPANEERMRVIERLIDAGITVHVYVNPIIPHVSEPKKIFDAYKDRVQYIDFEGINLAMIDPAQVVDALQKGGHEPELFAALIASGEKWNCYWKKMEDDMQGWVRPDGLNLQFFTHPHADFFRVLDYKQK